MALILNLKWIKDLRGKGDRFAKVTFRGSTYSTKTVPSAQHTVYFGETFEWPIARAIESDERLEIKLFNHNKYLSNKLVGSFTLILQSVIKDGELKLSEALVDVNNRIMDATIEFMVKYYSPDGGVGIWEKDEFQYPLVEPGDGQGSQFGENVSLTDTVSLLDEKTLLIDGESVYSFGSGSGIGGEDTHSQQAMLESMIMARRARHDILDIELHRPKDFQVCVTIVEAQQLHGLNVDPVIRIQIGDDVKYTSIKQSTNCPYYNEYFVFDYHETPAMLFDKMITITAYDATRLPGRSILRAGNLVAGSTVGIFKCDVGTVYTTPDHQFYRKWAVLLDPKDITEGPRGYIKCDLSVIGKGDMVKSPKGDKDEDNIEGNLLLPAGIPMERQRAAYRITIYKAEDLPRMDTGIMASVKKAITMSNTAFIDAYVRVSFIGHIGKTTVKKSYYPEWKEQLTFIDMFPPLCNRIKVQLMDQDPIKDDTIATHFIELPQIMDPGGDTDGILPTFGPCWTNFYGSPRLYKMVEDVAELNEGMGEGAAYKGRLLMSVKTELLDNEMAGPSTVYRDKVKASGSLEVAPSRDFLLFSTLYNASMIDKEHAGKEIYFELSVGLAGNTLDAKPEKTMLDIISDDEGDDGDDSDDEPSDRATLLRKWKDEQQAHMPCLSTTPPMIPQTDDRKYYYLPVGNKKPCLYVCSKFEDLRKRQLHQNLIYRIIDSLDEALEDVRMGIRDESETPHRRLRYAMEQVIRGIDNYNKLASSFSVGAGSGKTKLDKHRQQTCKAAMEKLRKSAKKIRGNASKDNVRDLYKQARECLRKLKQLAREPQHSIPDVFVWMVVDKKRVAYTRIPTREILHANAQEVIGKQCGKIQTLFLKKPGKKSAGAMGWMVQAKIMMYLWFGMWERSKKIKDYMENLPPGYNEDMPEIQRAIVEPPSELIYEEEQRFELRAYLFQARNLIGSDSTGLSDPFARVIIYNQCQETHIVDATLSPTWDQVLVFKDVIIHGHMSMILAAPPIVLVEIFDHDSVGSPEFLGRAMVRPRVKPVSAPYEPPEWPSQLQWWDIYRGHRRAGEILAAFELLQGLPGETFLELPPPNMKKGRTVVPLPMEIKPKLCKYRIEVMFWGIREVKRIQLMTVDKPRVDVECSGHVVSSTVITNIQKNCNFESPVHYVDLDLPENQFFWPPITIRCVDCRSFGREVLVGVHTITNIAEYVWMSIEQREQVEEEIRQKKVRRKQERKELREKEAREDAPPPKNVPNGKTALETDSNRGSFKDSKKTISDLSVGDNNAVVPRSRSNTPRPGAPSEAGRPGSGMSRATHRTGTNQGDSVGQNDVIIDMPDNVPIVGFQQPGVAPGQPGMPILPGMLGQSGYPLGYPGDPMKQANALMRNASKNKKERTKRRELIADLDWWSKYYISKEDKENASDSSDDDGMTESDADILSDDNEVFRDEITAMDYEGLNAKKLEKIKAMQSSDDDDEDGEDEDPLKKRLKKKGKKKAKKRKKYTKKNEKKRKRLAKQLKGKINKGFKGDGDMYEGELLEVPDEDKGHITRIKVFDCELEKLGDYKGFEEWVNTFDLYRGKKTDDDEDDSLRIHAKFKGMIAIYKLEDDTEKENESILGPMPKPIKKLNRMTSLAANPLTPKLKLLNGLPSSKPHEVLVRVYFIKAMDLHPVDVNGMADPYLIIKCGRRDINDKDNRQNNKLNPIFGKSFDIDAVFPMDSTLRIQVMDYDTLSADDLIGETVIDLENRLFSRYRPGCAISGSYEIFGYNTWRDPSKPSQILSKLCKEIKVDQPVYKSGQVTVAGKTYYADNEIENEHGELQPSEEHAALEVLKDWESMPHGWPLVPEHIETRPLWNPERPGVEQGRIEMWVDLFPKDVPAPSLPVDITPRKPIGYELRVTIWNTDNVILEDTNPLTGEASSDIFVRGSVYGMGNDDQQTDVHYRSLDGEGNFNWRFVFPFQYFKAEEKIIKMNDTGVLSFEEGEQKLPAKLSLQVWDADIVSADDYLGAVVMDLHRIPRPTKDAKNCTLNMLDLYDGKVPTLNIFKQKRCKGWWPFEAKDEKTGEVNLVGKVEAEIQLVTAEEADKTPVGKGRDAPEPLPEPNRPDSSFLWFMNPLKTLKYIIWKNYKWLIFKIILIILLIVFLVLFFYNFPGNMVQKMFGN